MNRHSYIRRLFLFLGAIITAAVLLIGAAIFYYAKSQIKGEMVFLNQRSLKQISQGTSMKLAEYNHLSSKIANNSQIIQILEQGESRRDGDAIAKAAQEILDNYVWTYSEYSPLVYTYVISRDGEVYASAYSRNQELGSLLDQLDYASFLKQPEEVLYQGGVENENEKGVYRHAFFIARKIKDHITGEVQGLVILNISEKNLFDTYKDLIGKGKNFYIADEKGTIISEKNKQRIGTFCGVDLSSAVDGERGKEGPGRGGRGNAMMVKERGEEAYFLYDNIPQTSWYLVETVSAASLMESFYQIGWFMVGVITLVAVLLLLVLRIFLGAISEPVMAVKKKMEEVSDGNLQVRLDYQGDNEFGEMAKAFNYMVDKMKEFMNAVKEEEKKKRLAEQEFLRAQINPHFIYNTLCSIRFFVEMKKNKEAEDMLFHFSKILRKSLSNPNSFVSLKTELDMVKDYVELQKKRYKDSFDVSYDIPEEILGNRIPVFILQPILENAIFHGMNQEGACHIQIKGYEREDKLYLQIADNGKGMREDQLDRLFFKEGHMSKVGVNNVHDRIQLNFGEEYGLKVESAEGEGTVVVFVLPVDKEGQGVKCIDC